MKVVTRNWRRVMPGGGFVITFPPVKQTLQTCIHGFDEKGLITAGAGW
jgi:hypothetical protein